MKSATLKDVANEAKVSIASASRAINGLENVAMDVRNRVLAAAHKLQYVPHIGARSLATNKTNVIGIIFESFAEHAEYIMLREIEISARKEGQKILVSICDGDENMLLNLVQQMMGRVDGIIIKFPKLSEKSISALVAKRLPHLIIGATPNKNLNNQITIGNFNAGKLLGEYLLNEKKSKIIFVMPHTKDEAINERLSGFQFIKNVGADCEILKVKSQNYEDCGLVAIAQILQNSNRPDAILCANDKIALGVIKGLVKANENIANIDIFGFENIETGEYISPRLSTIDFEFAKIAQMAVIKLFEIIKHERGTIGDIHFPEIAPKLIVRITDFKAGAI